MTTAIKTKRKPQELNSRQRQFAINYASGMTLTEAYLKAGYSEVEAGSNAATLFNQNQTLQAYYNRLVERKEELSLAKTTETIMQPHEVKVRLSELARANLVDFIDENGQPILNKDIPHNSAAKEYHRKKRKSRDGFEQESMSIKLVDQIEALRELAKIHGLYAPSKHMIAQRVQFDINLVEKGRREEE